MEKIELKIMTRELCHELYKDWENDESIFMDMSLFKPFIYDEKSVDSYFDSKQNPSRILFAIMLDNKPIGEIHLKNIDKENKECTLSIHMQNNKVKNKGYGTQAEQIAVRYAFDKLGMMAVNADTLIKNTRSQHVLEKVGFKKIKKNNHFIYYRILYPSLGEKIISHPKFRF